MKKKKNEEYTTPNEGNMSVKEQIIQFLKFLGFSISAGVIQFGLTTLLSEVIGLIYWPSYLIGLLASIIWNFTFNRKFTFRSASNVPVAMALVLLFYCVFTPISTFGGDALVEDLGWNGMLVTAIMMVLNFLTEYLWDKFVVFRDVLPSHSQENKALIDEEYETLRATQAEEKQKKAEAKASKKQERQNRRAESYSNPYHKDLKDFESENNEVDNGEFKYSALESFKLDDKTLQEKQKRVDKMPRLGQINYDSMREEFELLQKIREERKDR